MCRKPLPSGGAPLPLILCVRFASMGLTYFKRYRMEIDVAGRPRREMDAPPGYRLQPWDDSLLEIHAQAKYNSFRLEIDSNVFPCLGEYDGCLRLMREITRKETFVPQATWLAVYQPQADDAAEYCGTIQGIRDRTGLGAIQNIGISPEHRGQGLGSALILRNLDGFRRAGLRRVFLEVTAQNTAAIRLYHRLGFSKVRTVYKAVEVACT